MKDGAIVVADNVLKPGGIWRFFWAKICFWRVNQSTPMGGLENHDTNRNIMINGGIITQLISLVFVMILNLLFILSDLPKVFIITGIFGTQICSGTTRYFWALFSARKHPTNTPGVRTGFGNKHINRDQRWDIPDGRDGVKTSRCLTCQTTCAEFRPQCTADFFVAIVSAEQSATGKNKHVSCE